MPVCRDSTPTDLLGCLSTLLLTLPLFAMVGCAPAERVPSPANWPKEWDGRALWTTPNAHIYAARGASAGEIDRLAARVKREYSAELGQPTPPVLIIVRDAGEPYPGNNVRALLRSTLRTEFERNPDASSTDEGPDVPTSEKIDEEVLASVAAAAVTGTSLEVFAGTIPLMCDEQTLREICPTPEGPLDQAGCALILPTRACLRAHVRRTMRGALKLYGIGPAAQVLFAPVLAMAEAKTVDQLDRLRGAALFNHWLFEYADLPIERKREIAAAKLEEWGGSVEAAAASVAGAAN